VTVRESGNGWSLVERHDDRRDASAAVVAEFR
jgi:hypothetical protein